MKSKTPKQTDTEITLVGRDPEKHYGVVSQPVYHASTILFKTLDDYEAGERGEWPHSTYGRFGTPTTQSVEQALAALEGGDNSIVTSSGLSAITVSLLTFLGNGDHLLVTDSVYGPARRFCDQELKRYGIEVTYYDPRIGAGIAALMKPNTKVVYTESPGSLTFEIQDIPAIAKAAHAKGAVVIMDNTWATALYFKPFEHGVDVSVHSATKYISGHSDLVMGVLTCKKEHYPALLRTYRNLGPCPGPDNCYLALRGLRTMAVRLRHHQQAAIEVAHWLEKQPQVVQVLHPALESHPDHALWQRDFIGSSGLFSVLLKTTNRDALAHMLDNLELFGMGFSWGGFESLIIPFKLNNIRTSTQWKHKGISLRLHIGIEDVSDLIKDLDAGFKRLSEKS